LLSGALLTVENNKHVYYYFSGNVLYKGGDDYQTPIAMAYNVSDATLWTLDGNYLYYYQAWTDGAGNGNNLTRIKVDGEAIDYTIASTLDKANVEYEPVTVAGVQWNSSWYQPELFGGVVLYSNEQAIGSVSYNYISAAKLPEKQADLVASNEKYEEVMDYINNEVAGEKKLSEALKVYFRTGSTEAVEAVYKEYGEDVLTENDKKEFDAFVAHTLSARKPVSVTQKPNDYTEKFKDDAGEYYDVESYYFGMLGNNYSDEDKEGLPEDWKKSIYLAASSDSEDESEGLEWWAWLLIAVGGVAVVVGGVFLGIYLKKRSKAAMEERMRNSKSRRKIDTTDDKTIDVYADDEAETPAEEAEAAAPEAVEETAESGEETAE
jgi:hypothetical protein